MRPPGDGFGQAGPQRLAAHLETAAAGVKGPSDFRWMRAPTPGGFSDVAVVVMGAPWRVGR